MALSTEYRKSSTRREDAPSHYLAYLNSPDWRRTRNRKLTESKWTCERCLTRRDLTVHHRTYVRLGMELMTDLEVLCFSCHREHHVEEGQQPSNPLGIYLRIASEVLGKDFHRTVADISDEVKTLCAQRHIEVDPIRIAKAISLTCGLRLKSEDDKPYRSVVEPERFDSPITHAQAVEFLTRLGRPRESQKAMLKPMGRVTMRSQHDVDRDKALEMVANEIKASLARCAELEAVTP